MAPPDGSLSSTNPGSIPDTPRSLGCRCPRNSPSSASAPAHLRGPSGAPRTHLRVGVRAAVRVRDPPRLAGVKRLERRRRSPRRGARVEAGAVAAARRHRSCAGLRGSRSRTKSEPELLREAGPYRREAEPYGWGRGQSRKGREAQNGSERTTARKSKSACVRPKARR